MLMSFGCQKLCQIFNGVLECVRFPCEDGPSDYIDSFGEQCLSVFKAIGLPSSVVLICVSRHNLLVVFRVINSEKVFYFLIIFSPLYQDLPNGLKGRNESKHLCNSSLTCEFPNHCKFYPADMKDDLHKAMFVCLVALL